MVKNMFNIHEMEGRRDGLTGKGWKLAQKYESLRYIRTQFINSPILSTYEEDYKQYKEAFLKAYWNIKTKCV